MLQRFPNVVLVVVLALLLGGPACDSKQSAPDPRSMPADAAAGLEVFNRIGCNVCHSFDDKPLAGPSLLNIYGKEVQLRNGSSVVRDDQYLRDSILDSGKQVVEGFRPTMVDYDSMLQDGELELLLALIRFHSE